MFSEENSLDPLTFQDAYENDNRMDDEDNFSDNNLTQDDDIGTFNITSNTNTLTSTVFQNGNTRNALFSIPTLNIEKSHLDLETYIAPYRGISRIQRLLYVAQHCTQLELAALKLCLTYVIQSNSCDTSLYVQLYDRIGNLLKAKYCHFSDMNDNLLFSQINLPAFSKEWIELAGKRATLKLEKLDSDLKSYKNNFIKESIRRGHYDMGEQYLICGDLEMAFKAFLKPKDFCTTPKHILTAYLNIMRISIYMQNWNTVLSFGHRAETILASELPHENNFESNDKTVKKFATEQISTNNKQNKRSNMSRSSTSNVQTEPYDSETDDMPSRSTDKPTFSKDPTKKPTQTSGSNSNSTTNQNFYQICASKVAWMMGLAYMSLCTLPDTSSNNSTDALLSLNGHEAKTTKGKNMPAQDFEVWATSASRSAKNHMRHAAIIPRSTALHSKQHDIKSLPGFWTNNGYTLLESDIVGASALSSNMFLNALDLLNMERLIESTTLQNRIQNDHNNNNNLDKNVGNNGSLIGTLRSSALKFLSIGSVEHVTPLVTGSITCSDQQFPTASMSYNELNDFEYTGIKGGTGGALTPQQLLSPRSAIGANGEMAYNAQQPLITRPYRKFSKHGNDIVNDENNSPLNFKNIESISNSNNSINTNQNLITSLQKSSNVNAHATKMPFEDPNASYIVTPNNIAWYTGLCSLASLSRAEIKRKCLSPNCAFKPFLELEPALRDILDAFYRSDFKQCLQYLADIYDQLILDLYIGPVLGTLYGLIRKRALLQYLIPYDCVDITALTDIFYLWHEDNDIINLASQLDQNYCHTSMNMPYNGEKDDQNVVSLDEETTKYLNNMMIELLVLIEQGEIVGKIDGANLILYLMKRDERKCAFKKALTLGHALNEKLQEMVLKTYTLHMSDHQSNNFAA